MGVLEIVTFTLRMCEDSDRNLHKCQQRPVGSNTYREGLLSQTVLSSLFWICNGPNAGPDPATYLNVYLESCLGITPKVTF
jgi:hypothetical protein